MRMSVHNKFNQEILSNSFSGAFTKYQQNGSVNRSSIQKKSLRALIETNQVDLNKI